MRSARTMVAGFAVLAMAIAGCAAPGTGSTAASGTDAVSSGAVSSGVASSAEVSSGTGSSGALSSGLATGPAVSGAVESSGVVASGSAIPSAPGTAGSTAAPSVPSAPPVTSAPGAVASPLPQCRALKTVHTDRLTFTTSDPAPAPWFVGNDPADGQGYEGAVAVAAAQVLGYTPGNISWVRTKRADIVAGRATGFDVAIDQLPTPDRTSPLVDYSTGYFPITDSVVTRPGATVPGTLAALRTLRVAAVNLSSGRTAAAAQIAAVARCPAWGHRLPRATACGSGTPWLRPCSSA